MLGGAMESVSKKLMKDYLEDTWMMLAFVIIFLLLKTYIVQYTYNAVWPRLVENSGGSTERFRPLRFHEALMLVLFVSFVL